MGMRETGDADREGFQACSGMRRRVKEREGKGRD